MKDEFKSVAKELGCVGKDYYTVGDYFRRLGVYLSALANKILTDEETITLSPKVQLAGLGAHLERGTLVINSDAESRAGFDMKGGRLILKKKPGYLLGAFSHGGEVYIQKTISKDYITKHGNIICDIGIGDDRQVLCQAKVYYKDNLVWFKGKQVRPWSLT